MNKYINKETNKQTNNKQTNNKQTTKTMSMSLNQQQQTNKQTTNLHVAKHTKTTKRLTNNKLPHPKTSTNIQTNR